MSRWKWLSWGREMKWCGGHGSLCSQTSVGKQMLFKHTRLSCFLSGRLATVWLIADDFCTVCTARPYQLLALLQHSPQALILNTGSESILPSSQEMSHVLYTWEQRLLIVWRPVRCLYDPNHIRSSPKPLRGHMYFTKSFEVVTPEALLHGIE